MTVGLAVGLLLQALAIALLRHRLGSYWLRHPITILVLTSVVYQGISASLLAVPSVADWDYFRIGIQTGYLGHATLILSVGTLALTATYLLTHSERAPDWPGTMDRTSIAGVLDWRLPALASVALAVLTYEGRGFNGGGAPVNGGAASPSVVSTFFMITVALAAFTFLLRFGGRWFLPVLAGQSVLLAAAGERSPIIVDAVALIVLLARSGMRPSTRQLNVAVGLTLLGVLAITGVRADQGRLVYHENNGFRARVDALGAGLLVGRTRTGQSGPGLIAQAAVRLDGTSFTGAVLQAEHLGYARLSPVIVPASLLLAVPSAVWPSKLSHETSLNPIQLETNDFGIQNVNFLSGLEGTYVGFLSPLSLTLLMALLGILGGWGERWLLSARTPARLILLAGAVIGVMWFEQGLPGMLVAFRPAVAIAGLAKLVEALREKRVSKRALTGHIVAPESLATDQSGD
jgi:hypothetical protein